MSDLIWKSSSYINIMPTKTAKLSKKGVVVSIYVEKPTKRNTIHHHHHYYVHHTIKQQHHHQIGNNNIAAGKGLNRRAQLLLYSRRLRESAGPNSLVSTILSPPTNVDAVQRKPKHNKAPTCPVNWKIFNLNFCRSLTSVQINKGNNKKKNQTGSSIKSVIKSLEVTKKKGFMSKFLSMLQNRR